MTTKEPDGPVPAPRTTKATVEDGAPKRTRRRAPAAPERSASTVTSAVRQTQAAPGGGSTTRGTSLTPVPDEAGSWIEADAVEVHQGAIGRVDAAQVSVTQGAIGAVKGERIDVGMGAVGVALGAQVSVSQSAAGTIFAQEARVDQSFVRTLVARDVTVARPSVIAFLVAQRVSGPVRVLLDWRGALAFGAAFGILSGLLGRARRRG
jgi:hypothetical protein